MESSSEYLDTEGRASDCADADHFGTIESRKANGKLVQKRRSQAAIQADPKSPTPAAKKAKAKKVDVKKKDNTKKK